MKSTTSTAASKARCWGRKICMAGANSDVRVNVNGMTSDSVIAVVNVAGQVVDTLELDVNR